jgi:hypothetical protein
MLPRFSESRRKIAQARRKYVSLMKRVEREPDLGDELESVKEELIELGEQEFIENFDRRQEAWVNILGAGDKSKRERLFTGIGNISNVFDNIINIAKEDATDFLLGRSSRKKKEGFNVEGIFNRLLGADKYYKPMNVAPPSVENIPKEPMSGGILDHLDPTEIGESNQAVAKEIKEETTVIKSLPENISAPIIQKLEELIDVLKKMLIADKQDTRREKRLDMEKSRESVSNITNSIIEKKDGGKIGKLAGMIKNISGGGLFSLPNGISAGLGGAVGGSIATIASKVVGGARFLAKAGGPIAAIVMSVMDGITGWAKSEEWGVDKMSAIAGSVIGGTDDGLKGAFSNAGKMGLAGAAIGSVIPGVGTIIGGLVGTAVGGITGYFGGEKISKMLSAAKEKVSGIVSKLFDTETYKKLYESASEMIKPAIKAIAPAITAVGETVSSVFNSDSVKSFLGIDDGKVTLPLIGDVSLPFTAIKKPPATNDIGEMQKVVRKIEKEKEATTMEKMIKNIGFSINQDNSVRINAPVVTNLRPFNDSRTVLSQGIRGSENTAF